MLDLSGSMDSRGIMKIQRQREGEIKKREKAKVEMMKEGERKNLLRL